jgi:hypothetical protein
MSTRSRAQYPQPGPRHNEPATRPSERTQDHEDHPGSLWSAKSPSGTKFDAERRGRVDATTGPALTLPSGLAFPCLPRRCRLHPASTNTASPTTRASSRFPSSAESTTTTDSYATPPEFVTYSSSRGDSRRATRPALLSAPRFRPSSAPRPTCIGPRSRIPR